VIPAGARPNVTVAEDIEHENYDPQNLDFLNLSNRV
jgi:GNAT superfamily N-acetyltransferase